MIAMMKLGLAAVAALVQLSSADLTGKVTIPDASNFPEIIEVCISNTGSEHLSILNRNNVFDVRFTSKAFGLSDHAGRSIPIGGVHAMAVGSDDEGLLQMKPGQQFVRRFNLTDYVLNTSDQPSGNVAAVLNLAQHYSGVKHDGSYVIPAKATSRMYDNQRWPPGDGSAVEFETIHLRCDVLHLNITTPPPAGPRRSRTARRTGEQRSGMYIHPECQAGYRVGRIKTGIEDAAVLAQASLNAIAAHKVNPVEFNPFTWFFGPNASDFTEFVTNALTHFVESAQREGGTFITIRCKDTSSLTLGRQMCEWPDVLAFEKYDFKLGGHTITMCPRAYQLKRNQWPCTSSAYWGEVTVASLLIHESMHVSDLVGLSMAPMHDEARSEVYGPGPSHYEALRPFGRPDLNPDNYAWMSSYAWDRGFGGAPWTGSPCLNRKYTTPPH